MFINMKIDRNENIDGYCSSRVERQDVKYRNPLSGLHSHFAIDPLKRLEHAEDTCLATPGVQIGRTDSGRILIRTYSDARKVPPCPLKRTL
jgi:hypothetical protein